jgi:apolipoprotein N-acyltransferase
VTAARRDAPAPGGGRGPGREALHAAAACACLLVAGRPAGPWWAAIVGAALLWSLLERAPPRRGAAWAAWALLPVPALGYEGLRLHDPPTWVAVSLGVAAVYGVAGAASAGVLARAWPAAPPAVRPLAWPCAWSLLDLLAVHAWPWPLPFPVTPGYLLVGGPYVALAALGGPVALGVAWWTLGGALACARGGVGPGRRGWWGAAAGLTLLTLGLQAWVEGRPVGPPRTVALVQLPGPMAVVGDADVRPTSEDAARLAAFAAEAAALPADLHVWGEGALGTALLAGEEPLARVAGSLGAPVLAGALRLGADGGWRNSAALADRGGALFVVDKRHLVPGYEDWLTAGVGERWPVRAAGWRIGVLLCWESLFLDEAAARVRDGADLLAVLAHDGWAAGTATPWWHARAGRLVAWSVGRPVVVAAHDGPSMIWGHDGRLLAQAPEGPARLAAAVAAPASWRTPYVAAGVPGLWAAWGSAVAAFAVVVARCARGAGRPLEPGAGGQGCGASSPQAA